MVRFVHKKIGPSSEIERWQRKQRLLGNLTEQLKTKECKCVISALITVKSKVLKRWKVIDTGYFTEHMIDIKREFH